MATGRGKLMDGLWGETRYYSYYTSSSLDGT